MKHSILLSILSLALVGCSDEPKVKQIVGYRHVIPEAKTQIAAEWIQETVRAANPMSDEEPEDNIAQAQETAFKLFGVPTIGVWVGVDYNWTFVPYERCTDYQKALCDAFAGGVNKPIKK